MGGTVSKTTVDSLNEISIRAITDSILNCQSSATQTQLVDLQDIVGNITISDVNFTQGSNVDLNCVLDSNKKNEIAQKVAEAIVQSTESKGQAALSAIGNTKAEAVTGIKNKLLNEISAQTKQEIQANIEQRQGIKAKNIDGNLIIGNVSMNQSAEMVSTAMTKSTAFSKVINETAKAIDQKAKTEEENPIASIVNSIGGLFSNFVFLIVAGMVIFGFLIYKFFF